MSYRDFTEMPVWKKAHRMLLYVYKITKKFPPEEKFSLVDDIRRAAHSVVNNISEGFGRYSNYDKTRFYKISRGSSYEIINQGISSFALEYIEESEKDYLSVEYKDIIRDLDALIKTIETSPKR